MENVNAKRSDRKHCIHDKLYGNNQLAILIDIFDRIRSNQNFKYRAC